MYKIILSGNAKKDLKKLDTQVRKRIVAWMNDNLDGCDNPKLHGKALKGDRSEQWSYRVGDYRIIAEIHDREIVIVVISVAHRKHVYDR